MHEIPFFKIVLAYEDFSSGIRAREMSERLAARLKSDFEIISDLWKFDFLVRPLLREQATEAVSAADMVVISADATTRELPVHVKNWIKSWSAPKRDKRPMLVALLHHEQEARGELPPPLCAYLQQVAEKAGMDFFCRTSHGRPPDSEHSVANVHTQAEHLQSVVDGVLQEYAVGQGWSIAG